MAGKTMPAIYICGIDTKPGPRSECPNELHSWPLPAGYASSFEVAEARLRARWGNLRCPDCGIYGWRPSAKRPDSTNPVHVPFSSEVRP